MTDGPQVSVSTAFNYEIPLAKQLVMIAEAGFTHVSIGVNVEHRKAPSAGGLGELHSLIADHGLAVDTFHGKSLEVSNSFRSARSSVEAAAALDAPVVVLHAGPFDFEARDLEGYFEDLLTTCDRVTDLARDNGVVFALENLTPGPATELCARALEMLDSDCFSLCYDSSHEQIGGPHPLDLLKRFRGRIATVHLSDTSGQPGSHQLPGEGFIDWDELAAALRRGRYRAPVLMEVSMQHSRCSRPEAFLKQACEAGRRVWRTIHS
jgi:sugar phosphate isomerase/epimerase